MFSKLATVHPPKFGPYLYKNIRMIFFISENSIERLLFNCFNNNYLSTETEVLTGKSQTETRPRFEIFPQRPNLRLNINKLFIYVGKKKKKTAKS